VVLRRRHHLLQSQPVQTPSACSRSRRPPALRLPSAGYVRDHGRARHALLFHMPGLRLQLAGRISCWLRSAPCSIGDPPLSSLGVAASWLHSAKSSKTWRPVRTLARSADTRRHCKDDETDATRRMSAPIGRERWVSTTQPHGMRVSTARKSPMSLALGQRQLPPSALPNLRGSSSHEAILAPAPNSGIGLERRQRVCRGTKKKKALRQKSEVLERPTRAHRMARLRSTQADIPRRAVRNRPADAETRSASLTARDWSRQSEKSYLPRGRDRLLLWQMRE